MKYKQNLRIDGDEVFSYTTHVATIDHAARTLTVHGWYSMTTSKHVNHVADELGLAVVKGDKVAEQTTAENSILKSVCMVAKLGSVLCSGEKEQNDWTKRMLAAGLGNRGLRFPDDWNQLPEEVKTKRLADAMAQMP